MLHVMGNLGGVGPSRPMFGPPTAEKRHRSTAHPALKGQGAVARKPVAGPPLPRLGSEALPFTLLRLSQANVSGMIKKADYHAGFDCLQGKAVLTHAPSFLQPIPAHSRAHSPPPALLRQPEVSAAALGTGYTGLLPAPSPAASLKETMCPWCPAGNTSR